MPAVCAVSFKKAMQATTSGRDSIAAAVLIVSSASANLICSFQCIPDSMLNRLFCMILSLDRMSRACGARPQRLHTNRRSLHQSASLTHDAERRQGLAAGPGGPGSGRVALNAATALRSAVWLLLCTVAAITFVQHRPPHLPARRHA